MKSSRAKVPQITPVQLKALADKLTGLHYKLEQIYHNYLPPLSQYGTYIHTSKNMTADEKTQAMLLIKEVDTFFNAISIADKYKMQHVEDSIMPAYAKLKLALRDFKSAEACFSEIITHSNRCKAAKPNDHFVHHIYLYRSWAREELNNIKGAIEDLEHNIGTEPRVCHDPANLAQFYERRGNAGAAIDNYAEAYNRALADGKALSVRIAGDYAFYAGSLAIATNDFVGAVPALKSAIEKDCLEIVRARQALEKAQAGLLKIEEMNNGTAAFNRGKQHFAARRFSEARVAFDEAIRKNSKSGEYYYWRGLVNKNLQDYRAAIVDLESALALGEKLAQPHLTEIKKIQTDIEHQQRVEEDQKRRAMEEKAREKQRELENQRRLAEERERAERSKRLEDEKRQLEKTRTEQKQQGEQKAVDECLRELQKMQISLKQAQPNLSTIDRDFTNLEKKIEILKIDTESKEQFHAMRGNFYYGLSKKETNQTRKQAMLDKALKDFIKIMEINLFADGIAEKIEEIKNIKSIPENTPSSFSSVSQTKLSAEDQKKLEKKKEELRAKLNASTTAAASSSSSTSSGLFKSTAPPPCHPSKVVFNPRKNSF